MRNPFAKAIKKHSGKDPTAGKEAELGKPKAASLTDEHSSFLKTVINLIDGGKIDTKNPQSFIKQDVYDGLSNEWKAKTDQAVPNIITILEHIMDLHARDEENSTEEMNGLIEMLWQAKQRIEEHADVFIF